MKGNRQITHTLTAKYQNENSPSDEMGCKCKGISFKADILWGPCLAVCLRKSAQDIHMGSNY